MDHWASISGHLVHQGCLQASKNLHKNLCVDCSVPHKLEMHHASVVKKSYQHTFLGGKSFPWLHSSLLTRSQPLRTLPLGLWIVLMHPCLVCGDDSAQKSRVDLNGLQHCL